MVSEVLTLATLGAGVSLRVRKVLKALQIGRDAFQNEINLAIQHVAFAHFRPTATRVSKACKSASAWLSSPTMAKTVTPKPQHLCRIHFGMIAGYETGLLQRAHTAQTWRRRNAHTAWRANSTLVIRAHRSAIPQNFEVESVKTRLFHVQTRRFCISVSNKNR